MSEEPRGSGPADLAREQGQATDLDALYAEVRAHIDQGRPGARGAAQGPATALRRLFAVGFLRRVFGLGRLALRRPGFADPALRST